MKYMTSSLNIVLTESSIGEDEITEVKGYCQNQQYQHTI